MNLFRILQIALLAAALIVGLSASAFNGQSVLALVLAAAPLAIGWRWGTRGAPARA
jgi:hypothetical protein